MLAVQVAPRSALSVFIWSRVAIWGLAVASVTLLEDRLNPSRAAWDEPRLHGGGAVVEVLARWDSAWLLRIAEEGYDWPSATPAFFPLYPLAVGALGRVLAGHYVVAGATIALAAGGGAFACLYRLAAHHLGSEGAFRTVLFLAVTPMSLFLGVAYGESLFLLLAVACFLAAEERRLGAAAALAGLALLTRPQGVALLAPLAIFAWQQRSSLRRVAAVTLAPVIVFLAYPLALWAWIGRPLAFLDAQGQWDRQLSSLGPLGGMVSAAGAGELVELAFAVAASALAVVAWRRFGPAYGAYALGVIAIAASAPSARLGGLYSFPRLALVAFPCFMALAVVASSRRATIAVASGSAALLAVYVVRWSLWYWVS